MYLDAKIKNSKDQTEVHISGSFLILMRPEKSESNSNDIHAMVRQVHMKSTKGGMFAGRIRIGQHDVVLISTYGDDGFAVHVADAVYQKGFQIPEILYKYYTADKYKALIRAEANELRAWGRALLRRQQRRLEKGCYRCHNKDAETETLMPCEACQVLMQIQLDELIADAPTLEDKVKISIDSGERFGTPTIGVQPLEK